MFFCPCVVIALLIFEYLQNHTLKHKLVLWHYWEPVLNFARIYVFHAICLNGRSWEANLFVFYLCASVTKTFLVKVHLWPWQWSDLPSLHLDATVFHFKDKWTRGVDKWFPGTWVVFAMWTVWHWERMLIVQVKLFC